jgi:DNA-binding GntR family transcriptional regulator
MLVKLQKSKGLRQRTYEVLRRHISTGRIKPGQRLIENSVAEALGISRTPVREALALLARDGLLVPTTRGFVLPTFTERDVAEIYELRRLLEPAAFGDAVEHATAQGIAAMRTALADQRAAHARDDLAAFATGNSQFRQAWLDLVTNRRLVAAVALYNDHVQVLRVRLRVRSVRKIVIAGMVEMLKAAERRDKEAAIAAIAKHIAAAEVESRILVREQAENAGATPEFSEAA